MATRLEANLRNADVYEVCARYGEVSPPNTFSLRQYEIVKAELDRRQTLTEEEWTQIDKHEVDIGMTKCAVLAAVGTAYHQPLDHVKDNIWVYNFNWYRGTDIFTQNLGPETYVFFDNERVVRIEGPTARGD